MKKVLPCAFVVATGEIVVVLVSSVTALPAVVVVLAVVLTEIINGEKNKNISFISLAVFKYILLKLCVL